MNKQFVIVAVVIVALLGVGGWFILKDDSAEQVASTNNNSSQTDTQDEAQPNDSSSESQLARFTAANVAEHNTKDDCWTIISGKIYDLSSYIPRHQGGDEIVRACGTDGTSLFTQRETNDGQEIGSGTPHSNNATSQLEQLYIGDLSTESSTNNTDASDQAAQ
jgi:cytochrome b involved in lipid metabolism